MRRLTLILVVAYLLTQAFDSVIRWLLNMGHAAPLIYLRDAGLMLALGALLLMLVRDRKNVSRPFWVIWLITVGGLIALCYGLPLQQVLFGIKVWLPFVVGFLLVESGVVADLNRPAAWLSLWLALCLGVVVNHFYRFPWTGLLLQVGNSEVIANKEWTAGSVQRLSGFSRSSIDAAVMILLLFAYAMIYLRSFWTKLALVGLSAIALALTTTKGVIGVFLGCLCFLPMLGWGSKAAPMGRWAALGTIQLIAILGIVAPIVSLRIPFPSLRKGSAQEWLLSSMLDRAWHTWPQALDLSSNAQLITGRGIGGIGIAQSYFEPAYFSPADNLFVYLYITAGLLGAAFYVFCSAGTFLLRFDRPSHRLAFLTLLTMFGYGFTTNLIENACLAMTFGGLLAFLEFECGMRVRQSQREIR